MRAIPSVTTDAFDVDQVRRDFDRIATLPSLGRDHNALYHAELLKPLPSRFARALDVGCGTGEFARLLAGRAQHVDALDLSPAMIAAARRRSQAAANIHFEVADVMTRPLEHGRYDVIASIATLHHMPLSHVLPRLADALAPGGTLVMLDLLDPSGLRELPRNGLAVIYSRVLALARGTGPVSAEARGAWAEHGARDRYDSWSTVIDTYGVTLPAARLRRHLLWRYSAVWVK